ncbi:hypothetical protein J6590_021244 [Homalodisca vitripennis]|nr:hypothetical protein J6590_021244 [Homalodisca vitripennis]
MHENVFSIPKSIQATVTLLENLHIILEKTPRDDIRTEVLPMLYNAFESTTIQVQTAALVAVTNVSEYLDESSIRRMVLPKMKTVYEKNATDLKIVGNILSCIEKTLDRLERPQIIDEVLPLLWDVRLQDPDIILRVVNIYRLMLSDKKYGLSVNLMATRVMPSLLPQTVNPSLNLEQFTILFEVLQEMLDHIDRNQRNRLKLDNISLPSPERHRPLRHLYSSDTMHVPPFNIPNLRIEQRKTSSAEDMARKNSTGIQINDTTTPGGVPDIYNDTTTPGDAPDRYTDTTTPVGVPDRYNDTTTSGSVPYRYTDTTTQASVPVRYSNTCTPDGVPDKYTDTTTADVSNKYTNSGMLGGWWFGASPSSPDSNFLRVHNAFPNRRLSDNTLMTPKIRIAPSCASSPGGTPGGGLPIRRHSSIGPQERRGSTINLSPPTGFHYSSVSREGSTLSVPSAYVSPSLVSHVYRCALVSISIVSSTYHLSLLLLLLLSQPLPLVVS